MYITIFISSLEHEENTVPPNWDVDNQLLLAEGAAPRSTIEILDGLVESLCPLWTRTHYLANFADLEPPFSLHRKIVA